MMKRLEDFIFLQHLLLALCLVWNNFSQEEVSSGIFTALTDHAKPSPVDEDENSDEVSVKTTQSEIFKRDVYLAFSSIKV